MSVVSTGVNSLADLLLTMIPAIIIARLKMDLRLKTSVSIVLCLSITYVLVPEFTIIVYSNNLPKCHGIISRQNRKASGNRESTEL